MSSLINGGVGGLNVDFDELQGDSLNAHATPLEDTDLISGRTVLYSSVTPVEDLEDVTFSVPPDPECAFILNQTRLEGHFVVKTDSGEGVGPTDTTTITNHYCAALFSQIEVHLNGTQIGDLGTPLSYELVSTKTCVFETSVMLHYNVCNKMMEKGRNVWDAKCFFASPSFYYIHCSEA